MRLKHTEKLKVVVDTNTVISAPLSEDGNPAKIFELLLLEEVNNFRSEEVTNEIIEVFNREKIKKSLMSFSASFP